MDDPLHTTAAGLTKGLCFAQRILLWEPELPASISAFKLLNYIKSHALIYLL